MIDGMAKISILAARYPERANFVKDRSISKDFSLVLQQFYMGAREETLRLSTFFFLLFTPFSSFMTILTHIYQQAGLTGIGPATLATNYVTFIISTIIAPAVRWPLKTQLLLGGIFYTINYSSGIFAAMTDIPALKYTISCTASGLAGCSAGFLWVSQGRYIHLVCEKYDVLSKKGQMYGLFSTFYCFSNVAAGLITTFGLGFFDSQTYFLIITGLGVIAAFFCFFFVKNIQQPASNIPSQQDIISENYTSVNSQGQTKARPHSIWKGMKSSVAFIPVMYPVLLILVIDGFSLGIYSSQITHLLPPDTEKEILNKMAGISMISLGVGATISGLSFGYIADKLGTMVTGRVGLVCWLCSCGVFLFGLYKPQLWLAFVASFLWGFSLFFIEGWMYVACSRHYQGKSQAFSVNKQLHSIFYLFFQIAVFTTDNNLALKVLIPSVMFLALPALFLLNKLPAPSISK